MTTTEARYWDTVGVEWERDDPDPLWREHADRVNLALLERWLPREQSGSLLKTDLFDEAVARGLFSLLEARARTVVGMDLSGVTTGIASRRIGSTTCSCADVRALPFASDAFDVIVSDSTLDHFATLDEMAISLRELYRVLRPGGTLLLTLDNLANPVIALRQRLSGRLLKRLDLVPYFVGATCGPSRLRRMVAGAGFRIEEMGAIMHCQRVLAVRLARSFHRRASTRTQERFLRWLMKFEALGRLPTRYLTGHFIAVRATKGAGS